MAPLVAETIIQQHERRVQEGLRAQRARAAARSRPARQHFVRRRFAHALLWLAARMDPPTARGATR